MFEADENLYGIDLASACFDALKPLLFCSKSYHLYALTPGKPLVEV